MWLSGGPMLHIDNFTHIQSRRINTVLTRRHDVVTFLDTFQPGHVTHFNESDSEIGSTSH